VKWAIIKKKIIERENLQLEDYDIEALVEEHKRRNPDANEEEIKNYIKNSPHIIDTLMEKKVLDFIIGFAETTEIDFEEYQNMVESGDIEDLHEHHHHHDHDHEHTHDHQEVENTAESVTHDGGTPSEESPEAPKE